jgi:nucleoside-diphosphate-sugar epimerase
MQNHVCHIAYASSAAVTGKPEDYAKGPVEDDTPNKPMTHYGVRVRPNRSGVPLQRMI